MASRLNMRTFGLAQCTQCSAEFTKRSPKSVYCGDTCRATARRRNANRRLAKSRAIRGPRLHRRSCRRCCGNFATTDPYNYYCKPCIAAAEESGRSKYHFLSRSAEVIPNERKCGGCGEDFAPEWVTQRFCGAACKAKARRSTPEGLLNARMTCAVRRALEGGKAGRKWTSLVGYTADELRNHIERQFLPGMSWKYADAFHIDHIIPLASFNFDSAEHQEFRAAWALTNLRPLWANQNISKGAKRTHLI